MALRNARDVTIRPAGLSDALDGTNAFPGAMALLQNLVPAYHTANVFAPRPAAVQVVSLSSINAAGNVSVLLVLGTRAYGMISSATYAGKDQPFCYDFSTSSFVAIAGLSAALLPTTVSTVGDWVPATMVAVTNSLILVTHPGFAGGASPFFGWLDTSSYSSTVMSGNTTNGSKVLTSIYTLQGTSAPILQGVQPGQLITGTGIPANTYVVSATNGTFSLNTTGNTHSSTTLDTLASTTGVLPGMSVSGPGISAGTYVTVVVSGTAVTLNQAATATGSGVAINFSGGGTITMSAAATASAFVPLTVSGGTPAAPRWGAGNTNTNPLSAVPSCSYGFGGRAYFGVGAFLVFSDVLNPTQVSLASQALVIGDSTPITALTGVPLTSQLTGGVQQSMTVFKGAGTMYQITGDAATSTLAQNAINGSIGTLAPRSIAATPLGIAYVAVDGLRVLGLSGTVSDPVGVGGKGVNVPFLNAVFPSRMCAAYNEGIYRVTVQNGNVSGQPTYEYFLNMASEVWTGPHTFPSTSVAAYLPTGSFLSVPVGIVAALWSSDVIPKYGSSYTENGVRVQCKYQTVLLPDNEQGCFNRVGQMNLTIALAAADTCAVTVTDDNGAQQGTYGFGGAAAAPNTWGSFLWGAGVWGTGLSNLREYALRFPTPIVFRQAYVTVTFPATQGQAIGNLYVKYQPLGYNNPLAF